MSIGRRLIDMARSELNSLLDIAAKHGDDDEGDSEREALHGYSVRELEEELARRRAARQEVEDAIHGRRTPDPPSSKNASGTGTGGGGRRSTAAPATGEAERLRKAYAALEVAPGATFETVRKAYRTLMRKYHPDHHTQSPEKQRAANEVAQKLTEAYRLLEEKLRK